MKRTGNVINRNPISTDIITSVHYSFSRFPIAASVLGFPSEEDLAMPCSIAARDLGSCRRVHDKGEGTEEQIHGQGEEAEALIGNTAVGCRIRSGAESDMLEVCEVHAAYI
jgi:hypothetical protein